MNCFQVNVQQQFGGGEVYTRFLTQALHGLGWKVTLLVHPEATFWHKLDLGGAALVPVRGNDDIMTALPREPSLVICHSAGVADLTDRLRAAGHRSVVMAHMPRHGRRADDFRGFDRVFAVSRHVLDSLLESDLANVHPDPLYGVADLERHAAKQSPALTPGRLYDWDRRKFRDRLLSLCLPNRAAMAAPFENRRTVLTLGVVSRLTTIKQFPALFGILASILARQESVRLEIFGSGGYGSVRDLRKSLAPMGSRARFWGHQDDVHAAYGAIDFLMTGLPELEALGLNVIEAQASGTPVLAVNAPPFTETVLDGRTGYLYPDPRGDGGQGFQSLLGDLVSGRRPLPDPLAEREHLQRFSLESFTGRLEKALDDMRVGP